LNESVKRRKNLVVRDRSWDIFRKLIINKFCKRSKTVLKKTSIMRVLNKGQVNVVIVNRIMRSKKVCESIKLCLWYQVNLNFEFFRRKACIGVEEWVKGKIISCYKNSKRGFVNFSNVLKLITDDVQILIKIYLILITVFRDREFLPPDFTSESYRIILTWHGRGWSHDWLCSVIVSFRTSGHRSSFLDFEDVSELKIVVYSFVLNIRVYCCLCVKLIPKQS